jgi:DNA-binding SARP family transcriptional activator
MPVPGLGAMVGLRRVLNAPADLSPRLSLLGGFELRRSCATVEVPRSAQRLLAFLALHDRALPRTHVAGVLWGDYPDDRSGNNLRAALWRLGSSGRELVRDSAERISLDAAVQVDVRQLDDHCTTLLAGRTPVPDTASEGLIAAGDLLPGWYDEWVVDERERLRQLRVHALEEHCRQLTLAGRYGEAAQAGLRAVRLEPLRESAHRALIRVHLAEDNRGEALRQFRACARLLAGELGLEPSATTADLVRSLGTVTAP